MGHISINQVGSEVFIMNVNELRDKLYDIQKEHKGLYKIVDDMELPIAIKVDDEKKEVIFE